MFEKKENGFTIVEILVALLILMIAMAVAFQFFETYRTNSAELGEYETAKMLAINGIENERAQILNGDTAIGTVFQNDMFVNRVRFSTIVIKEDITPLVTINDSYIPMYRLTSTVSWKNRKMEVTTFVTGS